MQTGTHAHARHARTQSERRNLDVSVNTQTCDEGMTGVDCLSPVTDLYPGRRGDSELDIEFHTAAGGEYQGITVQSNHQQ